MAKTNPEAAILWSLNYRLLMAVITGVSDAIEALGVDVKALFLLVAVDEHAHPATLARVLSMPKPTVTAIVKRLEEGGFVKREIDARDLRRHRLTVSPAGRKVITRGLAILSNAYGERLARLEPAEQATLHALLVKMGDD